MFVEEYPDCPHRRFPAPHNIPHTLYRTVTLSLFFSFPSFLFCWWMDNSLSPLRRHYASRRLQVAGPPPPAPIDSSKVKVGTSILFVFKAHNLESYLVPIHEYISFYTHTTRESPLSLLGHECSDYISCVPSSRPG